MKLKTKTKKKALWTRMRGGIKPRQRRGPSKVKIRHLNYSHEVKDWKRELATLRKIELIRRSATRKKPIRKISKRQSARMRAYAAEAKQFKGSRWCRCAGRRAFGAGELICESLDHPGSDVHHSRGRVGSLLMDQRFWIPVCRTAHIFIQNFPEEARRLGLLCQPGEWNKPVKEAA